MPFSEHDDVDHTLQFYAATKWANELMAHSYSHLFDVPTTGMCFFTVYGSWVRSAAALFFKFTRTIQAGEPIHVFTQDDHSRGFIYIGDIVEGVLHASGMPTAPDPAWDANSTDPITPKAPYRVFNIGNSDPVRFADDVDALTLALDQKACRNLLPLPPTDVPDTLSGLTELTKAIGYIPRTSAKDGVERFVDWSQTRCGVEASAGRAA